MSGGRFCILKKEVMNKGPQIKVIRYQRKRSESPCGVAAADCSL